MKKWTLGPRIKDALRKQAMWTLRRQSHLMWVPRENASAEMDSPWLTEDSNFMNNNSLVAICLHITMLIWHCERREGRKEDWVGRASDCNVAWESPSHANGEPQSKGCPLEESCIGQKWPGSTEPLLCYYWQWAVLEDLELKVVVVPKVATSGSWFSLNGRSESTLPWP